MRPFVWPEWVGKLVFFVSSCVVNFLLADRWNLRVELMHDPQFP